MKEKEIFLNNIKIKANDKDIQESLKLEHNIEYRFDLVEEDALERGIEQDIEQGVKEALINTIKKM